MISTTEPNRLYDSAQDDIQDRTVFDPAALLERCMGQISAACSLLRLFRDRLPDTIIEISTGLANPHTRPGALSALHTLKGNAGNLSAGRLFQAATRLDHALRSGQSADHAELLAAVQQEADRFVRALSPNLESLFTQP